MLPRLAAEETLDAVSAVSLGTGTTKQSEARTIMGQLRRAAAGAPAVPKADPRALAMMGIAIQEVP